MIFEIVIAVLIATAVVGAVALGLSEPEGR